MSHPDHVILYVADPAASSTFYESQLGRPPVQSTPGFVLFALDSGMQLGLWKLQSVEPAPHHGAGSAELAVTVDSDGEVDACHDRWRMDGVPVLQPPTRMNFGYTCVAADPDGHRLRVFAPGA